MKFIKEIDESIFRGYDIRGIYNKNLNEDVSYTIGRSYGTILKQKYSADKCIVGEDARSSSPILCKALIQGINDSGVNVIYLGVVTSPMLYYANEILNIHAGVVVTASHNPKEYNGFKIAYDIKGEICGEEIVDFKNFTLGGNFISGEGKVTNYDIRNEYINMLVSKFNFKNRLKVVVDSGNGTASIIVHDVFDKLNLDVTYIYCESNPDFPNHHPDPAEAENLVDLQKKVLEVGADIGIAFDGDCDRVGCVDNKGRIISSDYYMAIISKYILPNLENKSVIFDVSCSKTLSEEIRKVGGNPIVYKTGNSYIKREMLKQGMLFGGEISGHTFFKDKFYGFDDGIYAGLRMVEIVDNEIITLSDVVDTLKKYYSTPVLKITATDEKKAFIVEKVVEYCKSKGYNTNTVDGARPEFEDSFAIIRMSNTTPKLTVRFEAETEKRLEELKEEFLPLVNDLISKYC
ncbi:MAG: phosphomannomutase [Clostridia bacterium]|jgi:phosphomannomutase/phosphoglucomutase|nr:phosphomannomutase [Clostridia bacterium]